MKKSFLQTNKYIKFLVASTLISCVMFFFDVFIGLDHATLNLKKNTHAFKSPSSIIGYTGAAGNVNQDVAIGDIRPGSKDGAQKNLKEQSSEFQIQKFWNEFSEVLLKYSPKDDFKLKDCRPKECKLETHLIDPIYDGELYSEQFLSECLNLNYKDYQEMIELHKKFVSHLPLDYGSAEANSFYSGAGIVMIGGGKYSVMTSLVISILRSTGTTLPIEVMILPDEVDEDFCTKIGKMNAKCIRPVITDKKVWKSLELQSYQVKIISLISCSFKDVLYLDSDNYPLQNLNNIFESEPYKQTGFISWPDFWRRSTSPAFYKISGKDVGDRVRNNIDSFSDTSRYSTGYENLFNEIPYHDREGTIPDGSSETSSLMVDKIRHAQTLMLSFYYNLNGPKLYYYLLSQGNFGEGDKETFVAAAHVLNKPFYQLKTKPQVGGELLYEGKTPRGCSMIQFDIFQDYELYKQLQQKFGEKEQNSVYDVQNVVNLFNDNNKKLLFLHYNLGKMDPFRLEVFNERRYGYDLRMIGYDFEFRNMELMHSMVCGPEAKSSGTLGKIHFQYLKGKNVDEVCRNLQGIISKMGETSTRVITN